MTWWQGGGRGSGYPRKVMTSFMNSPLVEASWLKNQDSWILRRFFLVKFSQRACVGLVCPSFPQSSPIAANLINNIGGITSSTRRGDVGLDEYDVKLGQHCISAPLPDIACHIKQFLRTILDHKQIEQFIGRGRPLLKPWHSQNWFNSPTFNLCTIVNLVTKVRKCDWHQSTNSVNWQISKNGLQIEVNGHLSEATGQTWLSWGDNCTIEINRWQSWWGWLSRRWWWCNDDWRYCQLLLR